MKACGLWWKHLLCTDLKHYIMCTVRRREGWHDAVKGSVYRVATRRAFLKGCQKFVTISSRERTNTQLGLKGRTLLLPMFKGKGKTREKTTENHTFGYSPRGYRSRINKGDKNSISFVNPSENFLSIKDYAEVILWKRIYYLNYDIFIIV